MKRLLMIMLAMLLAPPATAAPLLVAAASDLGYCIDDVVAAFRKDAPGAEVKVSLGASGAFYAQIRNGAPFDVFLSADMDYPRELARLGAAAGPAQPYAIGRIALWTVDARFDPRQGTGVLRDPRVARIAIASPATAPYGRAAQAALMRDGLWEALQPRLVIGENIAQAAQFVQSGNAQLGIVSLAALHSPKLVGRGRYYVIPDTGLAPIEQGALVTQHGRDNPLAARFVRFLHSPAARAIFERNGYSLPPLHE